MSGVEAIKLITEYRDMNFHEPKLSWDKKFFERRCAEIWAVNGIISRVASEGFVEPEEVVADFAGDMNDCFERSNSPKTDTIFKTARDVAMDVLLMLAREREGFCYEKD